MKYGFKKGIAACLALLILLSAVPVSVSATATDTVVGWDGTVAAGYESGTGTADDPYIIANGAQLAYFASVVESGESSYADTHFELGADIALNDTANWETWGTTDENGYTIAPVNVWEPIGDAYNEIVFRGTLDGKGYTISGIYINGNKDEVGLFSGLGGGATLKNMNIAASYVRGDESVGALVGAIQYIDSLVTVSECMVSGTVVCDTYNGGGVVGNIDVYYANRMVLSACVNNAAINSADANNVGGIVGYARYAQITSCTNNGVVNGYDYVGGVVGNLYYSTVNSCMNTADITNEEGSGGIVGYASNSTITRCRNEGDITVSADSAAGIVLNANHCTLTECENHGAITSNGYTAAGIVMSFSGEGDDVLTRCANFGSVSGGSYVSGIGSVDNAMVSECFNSGDITAEYYAGGVFGLVDQSTINDCYNSGTVISDAYAAGLAYSVDTSTISSCYSVGGVNASYTYASLIVDLSSDSTVGNAYFRYADGEETGIGTQLPTESPSDAANFDGFDFLAVWETGYDDTYAYPTLRYFGSQTYQYRITYQDGEETIRTAVLAAGEPIDLAAPESDVYDFAYWKTADGTRYSVTDTVSATANTTLTAVWMVKNTSADAWDGSIDIDWEGNGTEDDPYRIGTPAELAGMAAILNDDDTYSDRYYDTYHAYFKQTADLLFNDGGSTFSDTLVGRHEWAPIPSFDGEYDGGGYTIAGIYINGSADYVGVFGNSYAEICNVTVTDSYIVGGDYVGGIAAHARGVHNCVNKATVSGAGDYVGGIVGECNGAVTDCVNYGRICGAYYVGGVVGYLYNETDGVQTSVNHGTVQGVYYVGGVGGRATVISDCKNNGEIVGGDYVGGVGGEVSNIINGVNHGCVTATGNNAGGVVGAGSYINRCANFGDVAGHYGVGGVAGTISDISADNYSAGAVSGDEHVGGIVGTLSWDTGKIATSYAVGTVTATDERYAGGAVGYMSEDSKSTVTDCYYLDTVYTGESIYGTALSAAQMQTETAFEGFNFLSVWEIGHDSTYAYPTLRDLGSKEYRYRVTMMNGGRVFADRVYYMGVAVNLTPPEDDTYDFAYWKTADGTRYYADDVLKASEDLTLTAVWSVRPSGYVWDGRVDTDWAGSGTADDPYLITTVDELVGIAARIEEEWWEDFDDTYFKQTIDLVVNAGGDQFSDTVVGRYEWTPIDGFNGHYDGDGHTISGIYIDTYTDTAGLFGTIGGSLKNLTLTDSYIVSHYSYAGGLTAELDGTIENCYNGAYVYSPVNAAGGITAYVWWEDNSISNCTNFGTIGGIDRVGGIVGDLSRGKVSGCSNSGMVFGETDESDYVGGIVGGMWNAAVENCLNSGTVRGFCYVGGVVGDVSSNTVNGCINVGTVIGDDSVGGVAGENYGTLTNCYNSGTVMFDAERYEGIYSGNSIGGVVGDNSNTIIGVYNTGDVIGGVSTARIGGVVGNNSSSTLQAAYNIGTVTAGEQSEYVGAVVGSSDSTPAYLYYADTSTVVDTFATALTAEQMTTQEAYVGFDFETNWSIDPTSEDYPYPVLTGAPHRQYVTVDFVDPNGDPIASYRLEKDAPILYPDMSLYYHEDDLYVYSFDAWDREPGYAWSDMTITASFKKVAKLFFTSIEKELTVGYGYSHDNLQIDLESLFGEVICTSTTDYRLLSRVTWDMHGYDPTVAGKVILNGYLTLTDSPYYAMAEGATVSVTVTVLPEGDTTHEFEVGDLVYEQQANGALTVIGYEGDAQVVHIPAVIDGRTVTAIGEQAFSDTAVVSVTLPSTVTAIAASAFENAASLTMIVLPDGLQAVGARAFYGTALTDVTCPASLVTIGEYAFGYYGDGAFSVDGFTVYAFADTAAAAYAADNGFVCVSTQTAIDGDSQVSAVIPAHLSLAVVSVGEGAYHDTASGIFTETDGVQLMDISLYDGEISAQPGGVMTIAVPVPDGFDETDCHIFRINDDGSYKDMHAEVVNGQLVFSTAHLSVYAIIEQHTDSLLVGDMNGDKVLNMRDVLLMYQVVKGRKDMSVSMDVADITGDGALNMRDVLRVYRYIKDGE